MAAVAGRCSDTQWDSQRVEIRGSPIKEEGKMQFAGLEEIRAR